jgi:Fur family ferric uptake transcriptional regulator
MLGVMSSPTSKAAATDQGRRNSRPGQLVRDYLDTTDSFASAQQIHEDLRSRGDRVGIATVYRNLQAMAEAGEVDVVQGADKEALFRKCGEVHHHHLVCRNCGLAVEITGPAVERWASKAAADHGFVEVTHSVELFGLCANCASA